jgi:peptidyl-prolyl cis-trans isomerase D
VTGYPAFRQAAQLVTIDDFPVVEYLSDGGIFAIRMDGVEPAAPMPLDEIRDDVINDVMQAKTMQAIQTLAQSVVEGTQQAGTTEAFENILRNDVGQILTDDILEAGFDLELGDAAIVDQSDRVVIVKPTAILPADLDSDRATETRTSIEQQFATTLSNDLFNVYATQIQNRLGIELNQQAINAVHANFQ